MTTMTGPTDRAYAHHLAQRRGLLDSLEPPPLSIDYDTVRWYDGGSERLDWHWDQVVEIGEHGVPIPVYAAHSPEQYERGRAAADASGAPRWSAAWYAAWLAAAAGREMLSADVTRCSDGGVVLNTRSAEAVRA
jgi:hypothetical protein